MNVDTDDEKTAVSPTSDGNDNEVITDDIAEHVNQLNAALDERESELQRVQEELNAANLRVRKITEATTSSSSSGGDVEQQLRVLHANYNALLYSFKQARVREWKQLFRENMRRAGAATSKQFVERGVWKANEVPSVKKCGFLTKKKHDITSLIKQRRWFMLIGDTLYYYKQPTDTSYRGSLNLTGCAIRIVSAVDCAFHIVAPQSNKAYFLFAANSTEMDEWISVLTDASVLSLRVRLHIQPSIIPSETPTQTLSLRATNNSRELSAVDQELMTKVVANVCSNCDRDGDNGGGAGAAAVIRDDMVACRRLMLAPAGAKALVRLLNDCRGAHACIKTSEKFQYLCKMINSALLTAHANDDFWTIRSILNMSNTFYMPVASSNQRVYVMKYVSELKVWGSVRLWEEMFFASILREDERSMQQHESAIRQAATRQRTQSMVVTLSHTAFGQLLSFANEMSQMGLSIMTVSHFVFKICRAYEIAEPNRRILFDRIHELYNKGVKHS